MLSHVKLCRGYGIYPPKFLEGSNTRNSILYGHYFGKTEIVSMKEFPGAKTPGHLFLRHSHCNRSPEIFFNHPLTPRSFFFNQTLPCEPGPSPRRKWFVVR